ncbi:hypothetical protein LNJ40_09710 [Tenacibaculum dicentrarchi]|nr:hypothetical protein [Tenacibaculum dicentrarchi]
MALQAERDCENELDLWIEEMIKKGISASQPDHGYVNRKENRMIFVYEYFKFHLYVGDLVVLGCKNKNRVVEITKIEKSFWHAPKYDFFFKDTGITFDDLETGLDSQGNKVYRKKSN